MSDVPVDAERAARFMQPVDWVEVEVDGEMVPLSEAVERPDRVDDVRRPPVE